MTRRVPDPNIERQLQALNEQPSYTCPRCALVSYNPADVLFRYCGACHRFEGDGDPVPASVWEMLRK